MTTLAQRLQSLSERASFTMTDMAAWLDCDRSALRQWLKHGTIPHPVKIKYIYESLDMLDRAIKNKALLQKEKLGLPIPLSVKQYERVAYVKAVRDYALRKFPKASPSNGGV